MRDCSPNDGSFVGAPHTSKKKLYLNKQTKTNKQTNLNLKT